VLVTPDGVAKLLDFGIAKVLGDGAARDGATVATMHAMTPAFASPEQIAGAPVTTLTDVYSLGVLLYALVTGRHPHPDGPRDPSREPERPSVAAPEHARALRGDVDNIVLMALRAEPTRRYASAAQLSEDVRRHLAGQPVIARPDTLRYRVTKFARRNAVAVAAASVVVLSLVGGIVGTAWQARRARTQQALAEERFAEVRQLATSFLFELDHRIAELPGSTDARELLVRRALTSLDDLARDARDDRTLLRDLAVAYVRVGDVQGKPYAPNLGHTEAALTSYRKAIAILEPLAARAPRDAALLGELATAYQAASAVQARTGDIDGAVETQRRATALADALLATAPASA
jgi:non-specific serine/threonine protein kinase/serine/threonine-protein kinase